MKEIKNCERCGACISELPYLSEVDYKTILCEKCYKREKQGEVQVLEESREAIPLTTTQYVALELVKAWSGQIGQPASFDEHINNYLKAIDKLKGE